MADVFLEDAWDKAGCFKSDTGGIIEARSLWRGLPGYNRSFLHEDVINRGHPP